MTLEELDSWLAMAGRTCQITYRIKLSPTYLVRIQVRNDEAPHGFDFVQTVDDSLEDALLRAVGAVLDNVMLDEHDLQRREKQ